MPCVSAKFMLFSRIEPNFVVSAKIRLIRISAEKFVQPAEFKKNPAEGSAGW